MGIFESGTSPVVYFFCFFGGGGVGGWFMVCYYMPFVPLACYSLIFYGICSTVTKRK